MGFVGVREDSSDGAAAVILDMLLKFGILIYDQNWTWKLHRYANLRQLYCFCDHKTIENSTAFVNKLSNSSLSFEESRNIASNAESSWRESVMSDDGALGDGDEV